MLLLLYIENQNSVEIIGLCIHEHKSENKCIVFD